MPEASSGLMASVRQMLSTAASIAATRLELLANELHEERLRLTQMLLFAFCALFCFGMAILLLTLLIVVLFWDDHRIAVLGVMSAIFLVLGTLLTALSRSKSESGSGLFSASLAELARDREQLGGGHRE